MRRSCITAIQMLVAVGVLMALAWAQIPTKEERIRDSALNEEYGTYRAHSIRAYPFVQFPTPEDRKDPMPDACYRYDFQLPAAPRQAVLTVQISRPSYQVFVNGKQLVAPPPPGIRLPWVQNLDLTPHLRPGDNVIGIQVPNTARDFYGSVMAEGIVFCQEGSIVRLITDKTWKAGWGLPAGWHQPDADLAAFKSVEDLRVIKWGAAIWYGYPYYGPIQVAAADGRQPIIDERESVELKIALLNLGAPGKPLPTLSYQIFDEIGRKTVGEGTVGLSPKDKLDLTGNLRIGPLPKGAYRVRFLLQVGGEEIDHRDYEVASVGVIEQRLVEGTRYDDGMELKEIWRVDCTQEPEPGQFLACDSGGKEVKTEVVEGPAGKYRTFVENRPLTSLAYKFKVKELFVPHLAVIEWPDDAARGILAQLYEGTSMISRDRGGYQRSEASVICTEDHPVRSNQMQKLHFIYWSNEEEAAIHIWNTHGCPTPAAVSRITVYQILNDLPALRIADAGDRMIGYHTERGPNTVSASYYAGPLGPLFSRSLAGRDHPEFYRSWYTTTENMIKRMRFSGQNVYLMGQFMYDGALYPSQHFTYKHYGGSPGSVLGRDYGAFMLRMFERNGLNLVSGIEYVNTKELLASSPATLEEVINEGAPTLFTISKNAGVSALHGYRAWGGLNYFHPRVQQDILTIVEELIELYHGYPAWKGIAFLLSRNFGPIAPCGHRDDPLDYGYEDYTIELFQKQTGIKIPVSAKDPERFAKRYRWIMDKAKEPWLHWRCDQYTKLYCKLRDLLVKARPDLKLYLLDFEPMCFTEQAEDLYGHFDDPAFMRQAIRAFGFDPDVLRKEPGMVISCSHVAPGTGAAVTGSKTRVWWEILHNQSWNDLFANDGKGGVYIWASIPHYGYSNIPKGQWLFERSTVRQGYFWPKFMTDGFVNAMVRSNPTWMPHTCMDVVESGGRLHELRLFSRAYRSLPNGKYDRLTGNGLDQNIWVERTRAKGAEYAYAANADWWEVDVILTFAKGVKVHDLIEDQPVKLRGGRWSFHLGPYEVRTFRITGAGSARRSAIRSAQVTIPAGESQQAESIMEEAVQQAREAVARAHAREAEIGDRPGWQGVEPLEQMIVRIEELKAAGDLSRAHEMATSWRLERAQEQVVKEALEAIPFLVLGPFGKPEDTEGAGTIYGNPAVVPEYKGMETAYIPETGEIDFTKKYRVYPDKEVGWQQTIKADHLSFYGKCHSEHPLWMVAYAYTEVYSPQERDAAIWVGSANAIWVWVNGERVVKHGGQGTPRGGQRPSAPDQNRGNCHFKKGWNRVLVKAVQRGPTRIFFRVTDRNRDPLDDLRFRVPKAE